MEEGVNNEDNDQKETENKDKGVIHRYITENKKETNRYTLDTVVEGFPQDTSPGYME